MKWVIVFDVLRANNSVNSNTIVLSSVSATPQLLISNKENLKVTAREIVKLNEGLK